RRHDQPLGHLPVRRRAGGRGPDGPRGDGLQGLRGPALLPDVPRDERGGGDGDDRARLRRAHRQGAADGVRPRAQPPHRTPDGRSRWLMSLLADTSSREAPTHSAETMVPDASRGERTRSWEVADFPVPTGREEDWRFTPVNRLTDLFAEDGTTGELQ